MTVERYVTAPSVAAVPRFLPLGSVWITHHPVEDPDGPGLAHLTYAGALEVAAAADARLPTRAELLALHEVAAAAGTELAPIILPNAAQRAQGCVPGDARMVTRDWCEAHDQEVLTHASFFSDGVTPISGAGKHWRSDDDGNPAPPGLAGLCGWHVEHVEHYGAVGRAGPGFIQDGYGWPHNRDHADYATTTMLVREVAP